FAGPHFVDLADDAADDQPAMSVLGQALADLEELLGVFEPDGIRDDRARAVLRLGELRAGVARRGFYRVEPARRARGDGFAPEEAGEVGLEVGHGRERRSARLHGR